MPRVKIEGPEHKVRILQAARELFFAHGYDDVSVGMIAKEARVSKTTLYSHVGDKKAILAAAVTEECKRFFDPEFISPENEQEFRQAILDFSLNLLALLEDPQIRRFDQVMLSQALKAPEISMTFYHHGYEATYNHVTQMIGFGQEHGYIKREQPAHFLAELYLMGIEGKTYQQALYGKEESFLENKLKYVEDIMQIVLEI